MPEAILPSVETLPLPPRLTANAIGPVWRQALDLLERNPNRPVIIDAGGIEHADDTGIALLFDLRRRPRAQGAEVQVRNLPANLETLLRSFDPKDFAERTDIARAPGIIESIGRATAKEAGDAHSLIAFLGEATAALWGAVLRPAGVRWRTVLSIAQEAGANALPITLLVGFLMGVIMAFQIALVAQQFGAVIFVVNGVAIAMFRELGALMTAVIFAGRSGAAFAAEIGTQKVNEEVNALTTFGLDPVRFLVLPRLLASLIAVPLLTVFANLIGIFGGALVMLQFDISFAQFHAQLLGAVHMADFLVGIVKAAVFGVLIAGVGCHRGLATGLGASSVGLSATSAVVTSIVLIVVTDGLFAVLTNRLGI